VTAADYEALAGNFKGVGKVRAVPGGWNRVRLLVAPAGGGPVSDVLELGLIGYLEDKRMLGHVVVVEEPRYVPVLVTAEIGVESYSVRSEVKAAVERAAAALLDFERVDFGRPVYLSAFYERLQEVPGVRFLNITEFRRGDRDGARLESSGRLVLDDHELPQVPLDPAEYAAGAHVVLLPEGGG
jgi:hypothetical protein